MAAILAGCSAAELVEPVSVTNKPLATSTIQTIKSATFAASATQLTPEAAPSATPAPTETPPQPPVPAVVSEIHDPPGELYQTLFTAPVGPGELFQYEASTSYTNGPRAIAVLSNGDFLLLDNVGYRQLVRYDRTGRLVNTIKLYGLNQPLGWIVDVKVFQDEIYTLETGYQVRQIRRFSLEGEQLSVETFPSDFPDGEIIEGVISGIAFDCDGALFIEYYQTLVYRFMDVQIWTGGSLLPAAYKCNNRFIQSTTSREESIITAGPNCYTSNFSGAAGSYLQILQVLGDGSIYLKRVDLIDSPPSFIVDNTILFIGADGTTMGMARIPKSEINIEQKVAVGNDGQVYTYLGHSDSVEVIQLNFYKQLDPLTPNAVSPQILSCSN